MVDRREFLRGVGVAVVAVQVLPPRGVKLESTRALFHTHEVELTQEQLVTVNQGGAVTKIGGSHLFVIALAEHPLTRKEKS